MRKFRAPDGQYLKTIEQIVDGTSDDYSISRTRKGHIRVTLRRGALRSVVFTSGTPSDYRALKNFEGQLRRAYADLCKDTQQ